MKVYLRARKGRCVEFLDRDGRWRSTGVKDKSIARQVAISILMSAPDETFGDFAKSVMYDEGPGSYIAMMRELGKIADGTIKEFRDSANAYVLPFFSNMTFDKITAPAIQIWYMNITTKSGKRAAASTCNNALSALSRILGYAAMLGKIPSNPCTMIKRRKPNSQGHKPFTDAELAIMFPESLGKLLNIYGTASDALFFVLMRDTGFRPCEVAGLTADCYYPEFHCIYTRQSCDRNTRNIKHEIKTSGRGKADRYMRISPIAEKLLDIVIESVPEGSCLFLNKKGKIKGQARFQVQFDRILASLGIPKDDRTLYSFRSTFFSKFIGKYTDEAAMMVMGHNNWHSCYDQRTPVDIIRRNERILDSSNIEFGGEIGLDDIAGHV